MLRVPAACEIQRDGSGRRQWIRSGATSPYETLQKLAYTYDAAGNVLTITDYDAGGTQTQTFTYDALNRLGSAVASGGGEGTYPLENYAYSTIGNLTSKAGTAYTYGTQSSGCPDGALSKPHAVVTAGANTFCYDRNGNMVKRNSGAYTLSYDEENRLVGVSVGATADFVYDGDGSRVKGTVNGTTTVYVGNYFEWTGSTSTMKKYYYAGAQRVAMRVGASTRYFLLTDHLGSTALTTNSGGARVAEVHYKPWGEDLWTYGTTPTTWRYTGQRAESGIGLYYYNARWYDAYIARWVQADALVLAAGNPQAFNRYSYCSGNPLRYVDPSGHQEEDEQALNPEAIKAWGYGDDITRLLLDMYYLGLGVENSHLWNTLMTIYEANLSESTKIEFQWASDMDPHYGGGYDERTRTIRLNDKLRGSGQLVSSDWIPRIVHETMHMITGTGSRQQEYYAYWAQAMAECEMGREPWPGYGLGVLKVDLGEWVGVEDVMKEPAYGGIPAYSRNDMTYITGAVSASIMRLWMWKEGAR